MTTTDYSTLNEEWLARYRDVTNSLEAAATDDDQHAALLYAASLAVRAGRQGALQCAQLESKEDLTIGQLLEHTRREMDEEASTSIQLKLVKKLASSRLEVVDVDDDDSLLQQQDVDVDADVDAFFDEYPECIRSDWNQISQQVESDDDDDEDENDSPPKAAPAMKDRRLSPPSHEYVESKNAPPLRESTSASYKNQSSSPTLPTPIVRNPYQQQQQQQTPQSHAPPRNPYANKTREDTNNQFSYTQASQPGRPPSNPPPAASRPSSSSWDNHPSSAGFGAGSGGNSVPHHRNPPPPSVSNNHSSWEDHRNQQNPFQTAREFAQAGGGADEAKDGTNHRRRAQDKQQQQAPQQNSGQDQRGPNTTNPYQNPYSQRPPSYAEDANEGPPMAGGPSIPPSLTRKFQPPKRNENNKPAAGASRKPGAAVSAASSAIGQRPSSASGNTNSNDEDDEELPEELQHLDKELVKKIQNEIMESGDTITFDDIAGLADAKQTVQEVVCWPMKRPDLFTGLRRAPNGLLLYGPPGTGKTLIGKAIAHESGATFFSISSSSLTSKWIGEGEKLVRTLFAVAAFREPAVVFIDEIDSLLTQRKASENEASRRIKTEFLVQLDGTGTSGQGRVLVIGATNRPQELDEAARRRFTKRLYIPLPSESDRGVLLHVMLNKDNHRLTAEDIAKLAKDTDGFSGADIKSLCTDAAMGPIRQLGPRALEVEVKDVPPISFKHFRRSLKGMKASVAPSDLVQYIEWDQNYGSKRADEDDDSDEDM